VLLSAFDSRLTIGRKGFPKLIDFCSLSIIEYLVPEGKFFT